MELVVDANILFAALIKNGHTRHLILTSGWTFYVPEFLLGEMRHHLDVLMEKTGLSKEELENLLDEFMTTANIKPVPFNDFKDYFDKAEGASPDPDDVHYFALALKLCCALWSNDKILKEQRSVRVYTTEELSLLR